MSHLFSYRSYRLPLRRPLPTAHGEWARRDGVILRVEDASGQVGYGEAAPIPDFGTETVGEIEAFCASLGHRVDPGQWREWPQRLVCLRGAFQSALRPLAGFGSGEARMVAALLPGGREAIEGLERGLEVGFRVFKWKVGFGECHEEWGLLDELCGRLPEGARLRLDANGAWERRMAEGWLERCAGRPVEHVEQPAFAVASAGESAVRKAEDLLLGLAADYPTPIALDESVATTAAIKRWLGLGWPGRYVVKPGLLDDADAALGWLETAGAEVIFSSVLETKVGARAALARALEWPGKAFALGFGVWPLFKDARFDGPVAAPFLRGEDVLAINVEEVWNALN